MTASGNGHSPCSRSPHRNLKCRISCIFRLCSLTIFLPPDNRVHNGFFDIILFPRVIQFVVINLATSVHSARAARTADSTSRPREMRRFDCRGDAPRDGHCTAEDRCHGGRASSLMHTRIGSWVTWRGNLPASLPCRVAHPSSRATEDRTADRTMVSRQPKRNGSHLSAGTPTMGHARYLSSRLAHGSGVPMGAPS